MNQQALIHTNYSSTLGKRQQKTDKKDPYRMAHRIDSAEHKRRNNETTNGGGGGLFAILNLEGLMGKMRYNRKDSTTTSNNNEENLDEHEPAHQEEPVAVVEDMETTSATKSRNIFKRGGDRNRQRANSKQKVPEVDHGATNDSSDDGHKVETIIATTDYPPSSPQSTPNTNENNSDKKSVINKLAKNLESRIKPPGFHMYSFSSSRSNTSPSDENGNKKKTRNFTFHLPRSGGMHLESEETSRATATSSSSSPVSDLTQMGSSTDTNHTDPTAAYEPNLIAKLKAPLKFNPYSNFENEKEDSKAFKATAAGVEQQQADLVSQKSQKIVVKIKSAEEAHATGHHGNDLLAKISRNLKLNKQNGVVVGRLVQIEDDKENRLRNRGVQISAGGMASDLAKSVSQKMLPSRMNIKFNCNNNNNNNNASTNSANNQPVLRRSASEESIMCCAVNTKTTSVKKTATSGEDSDWDSDDSDMPKKIFVNIRPMNNTGPTSKSEAWSKTNEDILNRIGKNLKLKQPAADAKVNELSQQIMKWSSLESSNLVNKNNNKPVASLVELEPSSVRERGGKQGDNGTSGVMPHRIPPPPPPTTRRPRPPPLPPNSSNTSATQIRARP
jgi:hypothetical protein